MKATPRRGRRAIAPEIERGRIPVIEAGKSFRFRLGRKTPQAFFWVEWDPLSANALPRDAVLVMAEPREERPSRFSPTCGRR